MAPLNNKAIREKVMVRENNNARTPPNFEMQPEQFARLIVDLLIQQNMTLCNVCKVCQQTPNDDKESVATPVQAVQAKRNTRSQSEGLAVYLPEKIEPTKKVEYICGTCKQRLTRKEHGVANNYTFERFDYKK